MTPRTNLSHFFVRVQRFFGRQFPPEEVRFRLYFGSASRSIGPNSIKMVLEEMAWEVVISFKKYSDRKKGYDTVVHGNTKLNLRLPVDENLCQGEIEKLLRKVDKKYRELADACRIAHQLKNGNVPADPLDEQLLRSNQLRSELVYVAHVLGRAPSMPPFN